MTVKSICLSVLLAGASLKWARTWQKTRLGKSRLSIQVTRSRPVRLQSGS